MLTTSRLVLLIAALAAAVGVWRVALDAHERAAHTVGDEAVAVLSYPVDARLTAASVNLEQQLRVNGTYAGAAMPPGAVLARGDADDYCVQVGPPGPLQHLVGPGGAAATGPC